MPGHDAPQPPAPATSLHVRRAIGGDEASMRWVVEHLSPVLLAQASYRLGRTLRPYYDPQDIVSEAWLVTLPRLAELGADDRRATPVLLRFLSTTILNLVRNLARRHARNPSAGQLPTSAMENVPAAATGAETQAARAEVRGEVHAAIEALEPPDRDVLVLRGIEQHDLETTGALLGITAEAAKKRYQRALVRLRQKVAGTVLDELDDA